MSIAGIQPDTTLPRPTLIKKLVYNLNRTGGIWTITELINTTKVNINTAIVADVLTISAVQEVFTNRFTMVLVSPPVQIATTFSIIYTSTTEIKVTPNALAGGNEQYQVEIQIFDVSA